MASTRRCGYPLAPNKRWMTNAPTIIVMKVVHIRNASRYVRAVFGEDPKMKL